MKIYWDPNKAQINITKHGISFEDAASVFGDQLSLTISDTVHSDLEERFLTIGATSKLKIVVVVHTNEEDQIRIISPREASGSERKKYEEGN